MTTYGNAGVCVASKQYHSAQMSTRQHGQCQQRSRNSLRVGACSQIVVSRDRSRPCRGRIGRHAFCSIAQYHNTAVEMVGYCSLSHPSRFGYQRLKPAPHYSITHRSPATQHDFVEGISNSGLVMPWETSNGGTSCAPYFRRRRQGMHVDIQASE